MPPEGTPSQLAVRPDSQSAEIAIVDVISRAASDPKVDVDKMERLLAMQKEVMADQSRRSFNDALHNFQQECPQLTRGSGIVVKGELRSRYSKYEDMMKVIRPIMHKHGFSERFDTETHNGVICSVICTLSHVGGHSETSRFPVAPDQTGSKNQIQAIGSALSYGKRYSLGAALGLVFTDEDDDGRGTSKLREEMDDAAVKGISKTPEDIIRERLSQAGFLDDELTAALNEMAGDDRPHWTDFAMATLEAIAADKGWAKVAAVVNSHREGSAK